MRNLFYRLLNVAAPSGYEDAVQSVFCEEINAYVDRIDKDAMGNAIAIKRGPEDAPKVMLSAHCDEVGFLICYIDENGYLYLQPIGGVDAELLPGRKVIITTSNGIIEGVIGKKAIHLIHGEEKKKLDVSDVWLDIAASSREEAEKLVQIGDFVTFAKDSIFYNNELVASSSTDDRIGLLTLIETARILKDRQLNCTVYFVSSCQEELGARGAKTAADIIRPDIGIAIDVTHATDYPTAEVKQSGNIGVGKGPVIALGPNINMAVCRGLKNAAQEFPVQYEVISRPTGTDANVIQLSSGGVKTALVSIPCRYMHTPCEVVSIADARCTAQLLANYLFDTFSI